jgi:hypothetical protein
MRTLFFVLAVLAAAMQTLPLAAAIPATQKLAFEVLRGDADIGRHEVTFRREGEDLHVDVAIDLEVKLAFVTVFTYRHRNHEVWRDGKLVSIETETNDDGKEYKLSGRATAEGFRVEGASGSFLAPAGIIPTSYWNPSTVEQTQLLDTQKGRLLDVNVTPEGKEQIVVEGQSLTTQRYRMSGDLRLELWYGPEGQWSRIAFDAKGSQVVYHLTSDPQIQASLDAGQAN